MTVLLYGANGYVGSLLAEAAVGMKVVLAGRSASRLAKVAEQVSRSVSGRLTTSTCPRIVLNAAGPFSMTAGRLAARCVAAGVHYVDIAGEVNEYRAATVAQTLTQLAAKPTPA